MLEIIRDNKNGGKECSVTLERLLSLNCLNVLCDIIIAVSTS